MGDSILEGVIWVACPECKSEIDDLWDYGLEDSRWETVWCPSCNASIEMRCEVTYSYEARAHPAKKEGDRG